MTGRANNICHLGCTELFAGLNQKMNKKRQQQIEGIFNTYQYILEVLPREHKERMFVLFLIHQSVIEKCVMKKKKRIPKLACEASISLLLITWKAYVGSEG